MEIVDALSVAMATNAGAEPVYSIRVRDAFESVAASGLYEKL
jgi:hypothetical protein